MYLIFTDKRSAELLKRIYGQKNLTLMEVELLGEKYLVSHVNPVEVIPYDLLKRVKITRTNLEQVKKILEAEKRSRKEEILGKIEPGVQVMVTGGPYRGMKGVVRKQLQDGKIEVLISVFGTPVPVTLSEEEISVAGR